jgi:hypothetical protein
MSNNFNFFAPFFQIFLIPPGGKEVPLWQGPVPQAATDAGFVPVGQVNTTNLAVVSEFSIDLSMGAAFLMRLTLNPSYEDGLALLSSDMIQQGVSLIKARFGYVGVGQVLSEWYVGMVTNPGFTIGTEVQITLEAHVSGAAQAATQQATRQFVDQTRKQIVEAVAAGSGAQGPRVRIKWPDALKPLERSLLDDVKISMEQGGKSDLTMIAGVLEDALLAWSMETDPEAVDKGGSQIVVKDRNSLFAGLTRRVFRLFGPPKASKTSVKVSSAFYGGVAGESTGIFPIFTVSSQNQQVAFQGATRGHLEAPFNEATKVATPPEVKDVNTEAPAAVAGPAVAGKSAKGPATGNDIYANLDPEKGGGGALKVGDSGSPIQSARNLAALVREGATAGTKLTIETVGIPDFKPSEIVEVQGLGVKIDGTYSVHKVTHTLGGSGFTTKFDCVANGAYSDEFTEPSPNPTTVPTEPETGTTVPATSEGP